MHEREQVRRGARKMRATPRTYSCAESTRDGSRVRPRSDPLAGIVMLCCRRAMIEQGDEGFTRQLPTVLLFCRRDMTADDAGPQAFAVGPARSLL